MIRVRLRVALGSASERPLAQHTYCRFGFRLETQFRNLKAADAADAARLARTELARLVAEELNVKSVELVETADFRELSAKPNFKRLGPRVGKLMPA